MPRHVLRSHPRPEGANEEEDKDEGKEEEPATQRETLGEIRDEELDRKRNSKVKSLEGPGVAASASVVAADREIGTHRIKRRKKIEVGGGKRSSPMGGGGGTERKTRAPPLPAKPAAACRPMTPTECEENYDALAPECRVICRNLLAAVPHTTNLVRRVYRRKLLPPGENAVDISWTPTGLANPNAPAYVAVTYRFSEPDKVHAGVSAAEAFASLPAARRYLEWVYDGKHRTIPFSDAPDSKKIGSGGGASGASGERSGRVAGARDAHVARAALELFAGAGVGEFPEERSDEKEPSRGAVAQGAASLVGWRPQHQLHKWAHVYAAGIGRPKTVVLVVTSAAPNFASYLTDAVRVFGLRGWGGSGGGGGGGGARSDRDRDRDRKREPPRSSPILRTESGSSLSPPPLGRPRPSPEAETRQRLAALTTYINGVYAPNDVRSRRAYRFLSRVVHPDRCQIRTDLAHEAALRDDPELRRRAQAFYGAFYPIATALSDRERTAFCTDIFQTANDLKSR